MVGTVSGASDSEYRRHGWRDRTLSAFLTNAMVVVFTDSTMTAGGESQQLRYADVLIKRDGAWAFQTMIQGGWGDNLR